MAEIYRWVLPEGQDSVLLTVPEDCEAAEAVEFTPEGVVLREMHLERPEPNEPVSFPLVHIWDDPSRSEPLQRKGDDWKDEDTLELLSLWEQARLDQFYQHLLSQYPAMQVVYAQPPFVEAHDEGPDHQGWRIEMVAAIFGGFAPTGLDAFSFKKKSEIYVPDNTLVKPKLQLV